MLTEAATATRNTVLTALHQASAATGSDFQFLLGTAMRESGLKPQAKSSTSSATGLFQFVDQTWLGLVKQHGAQYGLGSCASAISQGSDGRYSVDNASDRQAILALRNDPQVSALMEGEYAREARSTLQSSLGRGVCNGELYAAHFLGPEQACRLIRLNQSQPQTSAAAEFPQAANANKSVFFHADGSAKSVHEVYNWALRQTDTSAVAEAAASTSTTTTPNFNFAYRSSLDTSFSPNDYLASATRSASLSTLAQAPFLVTPDVIDMLGKLSAPETAQPHGRVAS
ncbi:MAG: transglycosylase SLT domain-containing protein [Rhizomicrobium sp.]|jgi:hypothetical protein